MHDGSLQSLAAILSHEEGARLAVVGRYLQCHADPMRPPDPGGGSARVVLADRGAVLIGRYGTPECMRAADEQARAAGRTVRVVGRLSHGVPWSSPTPPPFVWTGPATGGGDIAREF